MISILHRDERLLVVNKPAGLMTHRSQVAPDRDVVLQRVRDQIGARVWPLHRLDRGTSGALAFALSAEAASELGRQLMQGEVKKQYLALVRGAPQEAIDLEYAIPRSEHGERVPARTSFRRLRDFGFCSLVLAEPETGRYHQVRRHLSHLRHPIAGDTRYGTGWFNRKVRAELGIERLVLHASALAFAAGSRPPLTVRAPLAEDFRQALSTLGLDAAGLEELCPLPSAANA